MPKPDLADILGKSGDFKFSFAVDDLITPAVESIDKASRSLMDYFEKQEKRVSKTFSDTQKMLKVFLDREGKRAVKTTDKLAKGLKKVGREGKEAGDEMGVLSQTLSTVNFTAFQEGMENFVKGKLVDSANSFIEVLTSVANVLGKNRAGMVGLSREVVVAADGLSEYGISARNTLDAISGLVDAGSRNEEQIKRLAPLAALTAAAVDGDSSSITAAFFHLEERVGVSGEKVTQVFANWKKASSELTGVDFKRMQETLTDPKFFERFKLLTMGVSEDVKTQMLISLGNIKATFDSVGADGDEFIDKIMNSLTDPAAAAEIQKVTGLAAHQVKEMLQTAGGTEEFMGRFVGSMQRYRGASEQQFTSMAQALDISSDTMRAMSQQGPAALASLRKLQEGSLGLAESQEYARQKSEENLGFLDRWSNKVSKWAATWEVFGFTLVDAFNAFKDFPVLEILAVLPGLTTLSTIIIPSLISTFPVLATAIQVVQAALGLAAVAVMDFWAASVVPAMALAAPWIAGAAAIGAAAYLIYSYFDDIKSAAVAVYDFFLGSGELEKGWLGTLQGVLRLALWPIKMIIRGLGVMGAGLAFLGDKLLEFMGVYSFFDTVIEGFKVWGRLIQEVITGLGIMAGMFKDALVNQVNESFIDPMNRSMAAKIPFTEKTVGSVLGLQEIPRLASGGIVTAPTLATVAEVRPEAVIPLDMYHGLLTAAAMANTGGTTVVNPSSPNVIVAQDRVVEAVNALNQTLIDFMRRAELPTRGSGFAGSHRASPRGF